MVATPSAIRDSIKAAAETISGLRAYDTVPGVVNPPALIVRPDDPYITYDQTLDGLATLHFSLVLLAQKVSDRGAQDTLDGYIIQSGTNSIPTAVNGRLGNTVADCHIETVSAPGIFTFNDLDYLGVEFHCVVEQ